MSSPPACGPSSKPPSRHEHPTSPRDPSRIAPSPRLHRQKANSNRGRAGVAGPLGKARHDQPRPSSSRPATGPPLCHDRWRTRPTHGALTIETLVSTTSSVDLTPKLTVEQRAIAVLCHDLLSIAEVSAKLHLPLGVVRILIGDMADEHLVMVHRPAHAGDRPDLALLERVLSGLHSI
jgi:hypothetical protein